MYPALSQHNKNSLRLGGEEKIPKGYLEEWYPLPVGGEFPSTREKPVDKKGESKKSRKSNTSKKQETDILSEYAVKTNVINEQSDEHKKEVFVPTSFIVSINNNLVLNSSNNYTMRFNSGILEGSGVSINTEGNIITFTNEGSYRFDLCGEAVVFSDVDVKLIYDSEKINDDIKEFSNLKISKIEGKLQLGSGSTILPIYTNQTISIKLVPVPDESVMVLSGTRLLIHRIA